MVCPVCRSESYSLFYSRGTRRYHRCGACGFIQLDESCRLDEPDEKQRYLLHDNSFENTGYIAYLEKFIEQSVLPNCPKGASILDFGSGPVPVLSILLRRLGFEVTSFDRYFCDDPSYTEKRYDLIILLEVIEHLADPVDVLSRLGALLVPGGRIVIRTMTTGNMDQEAFSSWWYKEDPTHISFFSIDSFSILGKELSLNVGECGKNGAIFTQKG